MACLEDVQIVFRYDYGAVNAVTSQTSGLLTINVSNIGSNTVEGTLTIAGDEYTINSPSFSQTISIDYPINLPSSFLQSFDIKLVIADCVYKIRITKRIKAEPTTRGDEDIIRVEATLQGFDAVYGCTNPLYYEYDANANVDDNSCNTLIPVEGCTNPLALNYNPNANKNDGSCFFVEGCTNPLASNYNELAVVDDGSCVCDSAYYEIQPLNVSGSPFMIEENCQYVMEFDMLVNVDCYDLLMYIYETSGSVLETFEDFSFDFLTAKGVNTYDGDVIYTGSTYTSTGVTYTEVEVQQLWAYDYDDDTHNLNLVGGECDLLLELLSKDDCDAVDINKFKQWNRYQVQINPDLAGKLLKYAVRLNGFPFPFEVLFDNIKFYSLCDEIIKDCKLIPKKYGFEFKKISDNNKSIVSNSDNLTFFNTKEVDFNINPSKFISEDVKSYYDIYSSTYGILYYDSYENNLIDVNNHLYQETYPKLEYLYKKYLDDVTCKPSKNLTYEFTYEVICNLPDDWYNIVQGFIPAGSIWNGIKYKYANHFYDRNKFEYRNYGIEKGLCVNTGTTLECEIVSDSCLNQVESIDRQFLSATNIFCATSGSSICETPSSKDGTIGGRLIRYVEDFNGDRFITERYGLDNYVCNTGTTTSGTPSVDIIEGCTDPLADNYNPDANFDNGSCIYCEEEIIMGCTYPTADNYNASANLDDLSCTFSQNGSDIVCGSGDFRIEVIIRHTELEGIYNLSVRVLSLSYTGGLVGTYKLYNFKNDDFLADRPLRHSTGAPLNLNNYIEFGFNQQIDSTTSTQNDSPSILTINDSTIQGDLVNMDFVIFTEQESNKCIYKGQIVNSDGLLFPAVGNTSQISFIIA